MAQLTKGAAAGLLALTVAFVWTINSPAQNKPSGRAVTLGGRAIRVHALERHRVGASR